MNIYRPTIERDPAEDAWLQLRAECEEEFDHWRGRDWNNREDAEIGDWLVRTCPSRAMAEEVAAGASS